MVGKSVAIKIVGGGGHTISDNIAMGCNQFLEMEKCKDNRVIRNLHIKPRNKSITFISWLLGIIAIVCAGLILYYVFGIK